MQSVTATQVSEAPLRLVPAANAGTGSDPRLFGSLSGYGHDAAVRERSRSQQVMEWHARVDRLSGVLATRWQAPARPARDVELDRQQQAWSDARLGLEEALRAHLLGAD